MTIDSSSSKVYYLNPAWRITGTGLSIVCLSLPTWPYLSGLKVTGTWIEFVCFLAFVLGLGGFSLVGVLFSRITTSVSGIVYSAPPLYTISATWDNIKQVETNPYRLVLLTLHTSTFSSNPLWAWYFKLFGYHRIIQLSPFVSNWATSELIRDIERYAPDMKKPNAAN